MTGRRELLPSYRGQVFLRVPPKGLRAAQRGTLLRILAAADGLPYWIAVRCDNRNRQRYIDSVRNVVALNPETLEECELGTKGAVGARLRKD